LTAIENVSRGKNATATRVFYNLSYVDSASGTSGNAVDGNYINTDLAQCATLLSPLTSRSSPRQVMWTVDLADLYAIVSITIYNTAVLPGINYYIICYSIIRQHRSDSGLLLHTE